MDGTIDYLDPKHLTANNGLSQNSVTTSFMESSGSTMHTSHMESGSAGTASHMETSESAARSGGYMGNTNHFQHESIGSGKDSDVARLSSDGVGSVRQTPDLTNGSDKEGRDSDKEEIVKNRASQFENTEYPSGMKLATVTLALILAVFCVALDNTVSSLIPRESVRLSVSNVDALDYCNCHSTYF